MLNLLIKSCRQVIMINVLKKCGYPLIQVIFGISIAILLTLTINYSWASTKGAKIDVVSLSVKNEPLKKVLDSISRLTDRKITVSERWEKWSVTVSLDQVTLDRALNRIIGELNHAIIYGADDKIFITILSESKSNIFNSKKFDSPLGMVEVIPPDEPGTKGVTQREIDAILAQQEKIDPLDKEVIPPDEPGEKGTSQRELNAIKSQRGEIISLDIEVIPPDGQGGKGMTQREIYAMKSNSKKD